MAQHPTEQLHEFLPLCDVLFNIISLASYFCDVVFDCVMAYALKHHAVSPSVLFPLSIVLIATSLIISQIISVRWYLWGARGRLTENSIANCCNVPDQRRNGNWTVWCVLLLHSTQFGVLWRYFKLLIPVNLNYVKHEVRELCVLRLIHAFCEAAPMLLLQLYLLYVGFDKEKKDAEKLENLTAVSAGLSLWSVCWAVASFSKGAARLRNLERLVLTWLGVLTQLAWRLGTVSARVGALIAYASLYGGQWLIIVMALHWLSMLMWLVLTPDGLFHAGEQLPVIRKTSLASLLAFVYVFAYVNLHETNHRQKMVIFYTVMFLENSLLIGVWVAGVNRSDILQSQNQMQPITLVPTLLALFFGGMFFMGLYYRFFHIRRLGYEAGVTTSNLTVLSSQDNAGEKHLEYEEKKPNMNLNVRKVKLSNGGIPGVFNCRFTNPTVVNPNRKKKKPTTFVPPPPQGAVTDISAGDAKWISVNNGSRQLIPFWKKSSPGIIQNDHPNDQKNGVADTRIGSLSVNLIREKLREKKQQQLRELRAIQEEIKEGKLFAPSGSSSISSQKLSSPSPLFTSLPSVLDQRGVLEQNHRGILDQRGVLSSWPPVKMHCLLPPPHYESLNGSNVWRSSQRDTLEVLLAPRCLPNDYCWLPSNINQRFRVGQNEEMSKVDLDCSQVSLRRSYTLPRKFKYNHPNSTSKERERRVGMNKVAASRFYLPSTNSSDGDNADNEDDTDSEVHFRGKADLSHNHHERRYASDASGKESNDSPYNSYLNNSYGVLRPSQLFRSRVKYETKL